MFLDVDGTLVEIAERPDLVEVSAALRDTLKRAAERVQGALAVVSGRSISDLDQILAPLQLPAAGIHGLEYRHPATAPKLSRPQASPCRARSERRWNASLLNTRAC